MESYIYTRTWVALRYTWALSKFSYALGNYKQLQHSTETGQRSFKLSITPFYFFLNLLSRGWWGRFKVAYDWLVSYLSNRSQFVSIGNTTSISKPTTCGVPQSSVEPMYIWGGAFRKLFSNPFLFYFSGGLLCFVWKARYALTFPVKNGLSQSTKAAFIRFLGGICLPPSTPEKHKFPQLECKCVISILWA